MAELVPWIFAGLAAAAAVGLYLRVRAVGVEAASSRIDAEKLQGELEATRDQLAKGVAKQRRIGEEIQDLRRKLDKTKRRAARSSGGQDPAAGRLSELEGELEGARQARDSAREEAAALGAELARMRAEKNDAVSESEPPPLLDNAGIEALRLQAEAAAGELEPIRKELAEQKRLARRLKGKLDTQEALYVSIRGELAAKKDRLRTQQEEIERLRALKAAFVDVVSVEGGGAADTDRSA